MNKKLTNILEFISDLWWLLCMIFLYVSFLISYCSLIIGIKIYSLFAKQEL